MRLTTQPQTHKSQAHRNKGSPENQDRGKARPLRTARPGGSHGDFLNHYLELQNQEVVASFDSFQVKTVTSDKTQTPHTKTTSVVSQAHAKTPPEASHLFHQHGRHKDYPKGQEFLAKSRAAHRPHTAGNGHRGHQQARTQPEGSLPLQVPQPLWSFFRCSSHPHHLILISCPSPVLHISK